MVGRIIKEEWGQELADEDELASNSTRCVRRFGRAKRGPKESKDSHVTGAKMADSNGYDVGLLITLVLHPVLSLRPIACSL